MEEEVAACPPTQVSGRRKANATAASQGELTTSLGKAVRLLKLVGEKTEHGVKLSWLARKANVTITTAHRLLQELVTEGLLTFDPYTKLYRLGVEFSRLAWTVESTNQFDDLKRNFEPILAEIADRTGDTVFLSVLVRDQALCVERIAGHYPVQIMTLDVGAVRPLGVGGGSMALLAALDRSARAALLRNYDALYERYGSLSSSRVGAALKAYRRDNYVFNRALIIPEVGSVGVPIFERDGSLLCAISVATVLTRLKPQRRAEIYKIVSKAIAKEEYTIIPKKPRGAHAAH